jgi:hypothetical protein
MPKVYFLDRSLPSDKKEKVSDEYFFDHLQDDIAEDYPVEVEGLPTSNEFDVEVNDTNVDPVRDVIGLSEDDGPQLCIEISTPDVPMNLRKSPPEQMIHQSTAPNMSLTFDLQQSSSSEESDTESHLDAKYEAHMRALGHPLCNWQFEKCFLSN